MDRRQRYREQTRQEVKRIALEQLAEHGIAGISVNAIGKRLGVTGPAIYRYFANRDALLTELIADGYHGLADTLEAAIDPAAPPAERTRAVATALRDWAVAVPHRYLLLFGTPIPGYQAPAHTLDAANRAMTALLATAPPDPGPTTVAEPLYGQLSEWGEQLGHGHLTQRQQHWGMTVWSRLHGVLSLEVAGQFSLTGLDSGLLYRAEVEALIAWWE